MIIRNNNMSSDYTLSTCNTATSTFAVQLYIYICKGTLGVEPHINWVIEL